MGDFYFSYKVQHLAEFYQGTDLINFSEQLGQVRVSSNGRWKREKWVLSNNI